MKRNITIFITVILSASLILTACKKNPSAREVAEDFIEAIKEGEYVKAYEYIDEEMEKNIEESDLSYIWVSLELSRGENESLTYDKTEKDGEYEVVFIKGAFAEGDVTFMITINKDKEVAGFVVA